MQVRKVKAEVRIIILCDGCSLIISSFEQGQH